MPEVRLTPAWFVSWLEQRLQTHQIHGFKRPDSNRLQRLAAWVRVTDEPGLEEIFQDLSLSDALHRQERWQAGHDTDTRGLPKASGMVMGGRHDTVPLPMKGGRSGLRWERLMSQSAVDYESKALSRSDDDERVFSPNSRDVQFITLFDERNIPHLTCAYIPSSGTIVDLTAAGGQPVPPQFYRHVSDLVDFLVPNHVSREQNSGLMPVRIEGMAYQLLDGDTLVRGLYPRARIEGDVFLRGEQVSKLPEGLSFDGRLTLDGVEEVTSLPQTLSCSELVITASPGIHDIPEGVAYQTARLEDVGLTDLALPGQVTGLDLMAMPLLKTLAIQGESRGALQHLDIEDCPSLSTLPVALDVPNPRLVGLPSLFSLDMQNFRGAVALERVPLATLNGPLDPRLRSLHLTDMAEIRSLAFDNENLFSVSMTRLPALESLTFSGSIGLDSLTLRHLPALRKCDIEGAKKMRTACFVDVPRLERLPTIGKVRSLRVQGASSLESLGMDALSMNGNFVVKDCAHLKTLPHTISANYIDISHCPALEALPERMDANEHLGLSHLPKITSIPDGAFHVAVTAYLKEMPSLSHVGDGNSLGYQCFMPDGEVYTTLTDVQAALGQQPTQPSMRF